MHSYAQDWCDALAAANRQLDAVTAALRAALAQQQQPDITPYARLAVEYRRLLLNRPASSDLNPVISDQAEKNFIAAQHMLAWFDPLAAIRNCTDLAWACADHSPLRAKLGQAALGYIRHLAAKDPNMAVFQTDVVASYAHRDAVLVAAAGKLSRDITAAHRGQANFCPPRVLGVEEYRQQLRL